MAFESALKRRHKVTSIDKANVLQSSIFMAGSMRQDRHGIPDVAHMYIDNATMQLIKDRSQFERSAGAPTCLATFCLTSAQ
ncbi:isocitrate/isopropylmalate family dehydrogenase [Escherichia coli]